jgi:hypothetical protein
MGVARLRCALFRVLLLGFVRRCAERPLGKGLIMTLLTIFKNNKVEAAATPESDSLEDILLELEKWGKPSLFKSRYDNVWYCTTEVNVTPTGVSFEAKSTACKTPKIAALECRKNLRDAVKMIGDGKL